MRKDLTPWFNGLVQPVRPGVYQRHGMFSTFYAYWNGSYWCKAANSVTVASKFRTIKGHSQYLLWRGLCDKPD